MQKTCYKGFRLAVIGVQITKTAVSFLTLKILGNYLYSSFFYCNSSKKLG